MKLLTPTELDEVLRYSRGKSQRLARRNLLPHVTLPDGAVRFRLAEIEELLGVEIRLQQAEVAQGAANA